MSLNDFQSSIFSCWCSSLQCLIIIGKCPLILFDTKIIQLRLSHMLEIVGLLNDFHDVTLDPMSTVDFYHRLVHFSIWIHQMMMASHMLLRLLTISFHIKTYSIKKLLVILLFWANLNQRMLFNGNHAWGFYICNDFGKIWITYNINIFHASLQMLRFFLSKPDTSL